MKKLILILVGVVLTVGVLATAGYVYAQVEDGSDAAGAGTSPEFPFGRAGMTRGRGRDSRPGMVIPGPGNFFGMGTEGEGPLHEYVFPAMAEAFGLSDEQVEAFETARETMDGIKEELSPEEIREAVQLGLTNAVEAALEDGVITQDEADRILDRMEQRADRRFPGPLPVERGDLLHEYMEPALAEALGVSVEELQAMKEDGLNLKEYAEEQGWSDEELKDFMAGVLTDAIDAALEDEAITQEQADWLLNQVENGRIMPFGPARGPRGWWNNGD